MATSTTISKILIANRSEVALRIQATCRVLGIKTVVVFCAEDSLAQFVRQADEAYLLPGSGALAYLDKQALLKIAVLAKVDAIHPGYGFLSEQWTFAEMVIKAGLCWIGPNPETLRIAADKVNARSFVKRQGIAVLDGVTFSERSLVSKTIAYEESLKLGFPVIIKDAQAGGGKAMRRVLNADGFSEAWDAVVSEGERLGCSGGIVIERYLVKPRHIEVQIAGDGLNFVHYYERECSVQRKHQKIIEEAPCVFLRQETRNKIHQAAVMIAEALGYKGIGTVEFLVDAQDQIYFMEINPRLQVEHSVTESVTGTDLVALQINIAQGKGLLLEQEAIAIVGHAVEVRIYAEDPSLQFMPSTGVLKRVAFPRSRYVRVDCDLEEGSEVSSYFDPMIAKITVYGANRLAALDSMHVVLQNSCIEGIKTNISFLDAIITASFFEQGLLHTQLLEDKDFLSGLLKSQALIIDDNHKVIAFAGYMLDDYLQKSRPNGVVVAKSQSVVDENNHACVSTCACAWRAQLWS